MSTKQHPGQFNCYASACVDEPIFTILGRDPAGPATLRFWMQERIRCGKIKDDDDMARITAAGEEAEAMRDWRESNKDFAGTGQALWRMDRPTSEGNPVCVAPTSGNGVWLSHSDMLALRDYVEQGDRKTALLAIDTLIEARKNQVREEIETNGTAQDVPITTEAAGKFIGDAVQDALDREEAGEDIYADVAAATGVSRKTVKEHALSVGYGGDGVDLAASPEMPDHRFAVFHKAGIYAYARGLEVAPQHLPDALDRLDKDGWELLAIFGVTDSTNIGFIFKRRRQPYVRPELIKIGEADVDPATLAELKAQISSKDVKVEPKPGFEHPGSVGKLPDGIDVEIELHITARDLDDARWAAEQAQESLGPPWRAPTRVYAVIAGQNEPAFDMACFGEGTCIEWDRGEGLRP